jgi:hypothetical protein
MESGNWLSHLKVSMAEAERRRLALKAKTNGILAATKARRGERKWKTYTNERLIGDMQVRESGLRCARERMVPSPSIPKVRNHGDKQLKDIPAVENEEGDLTFEEVLSLREGDPKLGEELHAWAAAEGHTLAKAPSVPQIAFCDTFEPTNIKTSHEKVEDASKKGAKDKDDDISFDTMLAMVGGDPELVEELLVWATEQGILKITHPQLPTTAVSALTPPKARASTDIHKKHDTATSIDKSEKEKALWDAQRQRAVRHFAKKSEAEQREPPSKVQDVKASPSKNLVAASEEDLLAMVGGDKELFEELKAWNQSKKSEEWATTRQRAVEHFSDTRQDQKHRNKALPEIPAPALYEGAAPNDTASASESDEDLLAMVGGDMELFEELRAWSQGKNDK